jgi:DNA helicase-2/ATP-dependent DNA helicase PcrA
MPYILPLVLASEARDDFAVMNALRAECPSLSKECLVGKSVATLLTRLKNDIDTLIGMLRLDSISTFPSQNCRNAHWR